MTERRPDAPPDIAEMKHLLLKAVVHEDLVDRAREASSDPCLQGDADSGYWLAFNHSGGLEHQPDRIPEGYRVVMGHYRLPPIGRTRTSREWAVLEDYRGDPVRTFDVWAEPGAFPQGYYARWAAQIDDAFRSWDGLIGG